MGDELPTPQTSYTLSPSLPLVALDSLRFFLLHIERQRSTALLDKPQPASAFLFPSIQSTSIKYPTLKQFENDT